MSRKANHLLICLFLSLTLVSAGAVGAASRLSMALAMDAVTEVVICAEGGAQIVTVNAEGRIVPQRTPGQCARCAECCQAMAAPTTQPVGPDPVTQTLVPELEMSDPDFTLTRAVRLQWARAPPKVL